MLDGVKRWAGAQWWRASNRVASDRTLLYGGATGLRAVTFHETAPDQLERFKRVVEWCRGRFELATPADADDLFEGRWRPGRVDQMLVTFDDGLASNYAAARWLADQGVQAIFFIVPSLVDRTMAEYLRYHAERGVQAHVPLAVSDTGGLRASQVREMAAMGHRIGAHNFAHRDLGRLHSPSEIRYEVDDAIEMVGALTSRACRDFAIGFGQPENLSDEAVAHLLERCPHVFACHRGLNVPGKTPRFVLRHAFEAEHPEAFTRICLEGGADRRLADRAGEMVRRVGVLPAGPEQRPG
jgi:peptidoglycan/xylan/chitin deacetylase (PgdA/CDA1 family)